MPSLTRRFKDTISVIRDGKVLGQTNAQITSNVIAARGTIQIERGDVIEWQAPTGLVRFEVTSASYFGKTPSHYQLRVKRVAL